MFPSITEAAIICPVLWKAAPPTEVPKTETLLLFSKKNIIIIDSSPPKKEYINEVNPVKSIDVTKHFILITEKEYKKPNLIKTSKIIQFDRPNLIPGILIIDDIGTKRSSVEITIAREAKIPQIDIFFVIRKSHPLHFYQKQLLAAIY